VQLTHDDLKKIAETATSRFELWTSLINQSSARTVAEVGVYRGEFARHILGSCPAIESYCMIDPWRHLDDWNKPANRPDDTFQKIYDEAMDATADHADKRIVLRGRTTEVVDQIADSSLDFAYIDGDHTLRGITIDLVKVLPKIRPGGLIGGDDFRPSIWQHKDGFEPTLVFPLAVHFAEAIGARVYALPYGQFLIQRSPDEAHEFVDLTGRYPSTDLLPQFKKFQKDRQPAAAMRRSGWRKLLRSGRG
jgi:Methyltransferase domain